MHVLFKAGSAWAFTESAPRFVQSARGATRRGAACGIEVCEKRLRGKAREVYNRGRRSGKKKGDMMTGGLVGRWLLLYNYLYCCFDDSNNPYHGRI